MMVVFLDLADSSSVDGDGELFEMRLVGEELEYVVRVCRVRRKDLL